MYIYTLSASSRTYHVNHALAFCRSERPHALVLRPHELVA